MSPSPEHEADTGRKRWRRWLQISLRTLLLLIALVAVAALAASWYEAPFRRQREAMAAIEQAGGSYQAVAAGPAWLRRLFGEESFRNVTLVNVADSDDPASYVDHIARLPALETLVVGGPGFTDEHVRRLHGLATLSGLVLDCTEVTDDGIAALRQALGDVEVYRSQRRSIRWLEDLGCRLQKKPPPHSRLQPLVGSEWFDELMAVDIANVPFGDADTAILKPLHGLRGLTITGLNMVYATPPQGVTPAKTRGPSGTGRAERLRERPKVTDAGLAWLQGLSQLGRLILDTQPDISDAGLDHLQGLKQLYQINLNGTGVTDAGLAKLKELDKLFWLGLRRTRVTDAGLVHLQGLPRLTEVFLADTAVSDAGVATLAALPLESLDLDRTPITDAALAQPQNQRSLHTIDPERHARDGCRASAHRQLQAAGHAGTGPNPGERPGAGSSGRSGSAHPVGPQRNPGGRRGSGASSGADPARLPSPQRHEGHRRGVGAAQDPHQAAPSASAGNERHRGRRIATP